jgi:hypothetical protein
MAVWRKIPYTNDLTPSLPVFTDGDGILASKTVADTLTALGLPSDPIKGDGTAGRTLRTVYLVISNGTNASTLLVSCVGIWNGDNNAPENNLGKGGNGTAFALDAGGVTLTLKNAGISGDAVAVLSSSMRYNLSGTVLSVIAIKTASGIDIGVTNASTGVDLDLTTLVDTGLMQIYITYLTSA